MCIELIRKACRDVKHSRDVHLKDVLMLIRLRITNADNIVKSFVVFFVKKFLLEKTAASMCRLRLSVIHRSFQC